MDLIGKYALTPSRGIYIALVCGHQTLQGFGVVREHERSCARVGTKPFRGLVGKKRADGSRKLCHFALEMGVFIDSAR